MKRVIILTAFIFAYFALSAQDARSISLKIVGTRGRPVQGIMVGSNDNTQTGVTDRNGLFVFENMTDEDSINVVLSRIGSISISVDGMDSIVVTQRNARSYFYTDTGGSRVMLERTSITAGSLLDVSELLKQRPVNSLAELLRGSVAGLTITPNNSGYIRGIGSINANTEVLVVVDGIPLGTLSEANNLLNVYELQTIEVLNNASEYGLRGANGVISIKTKNTNF